MPVTATLGATLGRLRLDRDFRQPSEPTAEVVLRLSRPSDQGALERLAALESRPLADGPFVVVVLDHELVAAVPLENGSPALADPFRHTAALVRLAEQRVGAIRPAAPRTRPAPRRLARA